MSAPGPDDDPPPRRTRERFTVAVLLAAAVAGVVLLLLSDVFRSAGPASEREHATEIDDPSPSRLRSTTRPRKPVPADAVDVQVVSKDRQEPVPGIEVRLRTVLGAEATDDVTIARTDADGRVRLSGEMPGFVDVMTTSVTATPSVVATDGGRELRFEVVPRAPYRATLLDATTGLPLAGWHLSPAGLDAEDEPLKTDGQGVVSWPGLRSPPTLVAAWDGRRRIHSFLLYAIPDRTEVRLAIPPATRSTRIRVVDPNRRPVAGARVHVISEATGVTLDLDDDGQGDLEYGERDAVSIAVTAAGRARRSLLLDGQPEVTLVLEPTAPRTFLVRKSDGGDVPDGTRLRGYVHGPASYQEQGAGIEFRAVTEAGSATVTDLPAATFEGLVEVEGPGVLSLIRFAGTEDSTYTIVLEVGPPRVMRLRLVRQGPDGAEGAPVADLVRVHATVAGGCRAQPDAAREALEIASFEGRSEEWPATLSLRTGPDVAVVVPTCAETRGIQVAGPGATYGCLEVGPLDTETVREVRLLATGAHVDTERTTILVEWDDGVPAALADLEVRRDEPGAPALRSLTDSSGTAVLDVAAGRFVVTTTRPDGTRFAGDGPLLLPAPGVPLVRLKPLPR